MKEQWIKQCLLYTAPAGSGSQETFCPKPGAGESFRNDLESNKVCFIKNKKSCSSLKCNDLSVQIDHEFNSEILKRLTVIHAN